MMIGISLELEDGREAHIRFSPDAHEGARVRCRESLNCTHELSKQQCEALFGVINVPYNGNALESVRTVIKQRKVWNLFRAIHEGTALSDSSSSVPMPEWTSASTTELLELYMAGFSLSMLSDHFRRNTESIVRRLSAVIFDDHRLERDPSKPRHQKTWAKQEIDFLVRQVQRSRKPSEISRLMGRDSLGIAYKMLESFPIPIPRSVLKHYGVNTDMEPLDLETLDPEPF